MNIQSYVNELNENSKATYKKCMNTPYNEELPALFHRKVIEICSYYYWSKLNVRPDFKQLINNLTQAEFTEWISTCVSTFKAKKDWTDIPLLKIFEFTTGIYISRMTDDELIGYFCFASEVY